jgi:hypothetical protein
MQIETKKQAQPATSARLGKNSGDGINCINVDIAGKTELGRMLSHYYVQEFEHPIFGKFTCMEGFWHYINTCDKPTHRNAAKQYGKDGKETPPAIRDDLRRLHGRAVNKVSREFQKRHVKDFQQIILEANYYRIMQNPELKKKLIESTLKFDYYFLYGPMSLELRPKGHAWITRMYETLRTMIKNGEKPETPDYTDVLSDTGNE